MNELKMRDEFEAWLVQDQTNKLQPKMGSHFDYSACEKVVSAIWLDVNGEGYAAPGTTERWEAWQASRAAMVIGLPPAPSVPEHAEEAIDDSHMDAYHSAIGMRHACAKFIEAAGLKVLP